MRFVALGAVLPALLWSAMALGEPRFGRASDLVIGADRLLPIAGYSVQSTTSSQGLVETTTIDRGVSIALSVGREPTLGSLHTVPRLAGDFFVIDRLSVGTALPIAFGLAGVREREQSQPGGQTVRRNASPSSTLFGFSPRVGYALGLSDKLTFWPRAGVAFYSLRETSEQSTEASGVARTTDTVTLFSLDLEPQVVWTPVSNWFLHGGLLACVPLTGARSTELEQSGATSTRTDDFSVFRIGLSAGLGGWLSL